MVGKETVKVNDKAVSSKFSMTGTEHVFKINEDEKEVECKLSTGFGFGGAIVNLYKNEKPVIEFPKHRWVGVFLITGLLIFLIDVTYRLFT